jgi:UDP:flavonoid glycosyltransferase YjiC (YdhE family)
VIPQQVEQAIVASQVVKYGAGISLGAKPPFGKVTANELQQALAKLLSNTEQYKTQAKILGDSLREAGGYARAADEIQAFMKNGSA